jgi:hypothetical protein
LKDFSRKGAKVAKEYNAKLSVYTLVIAGRRVCQSVPLWYANAVFKTV